MSIVGKVYVRHFIIAQDSDFCPQRLHKMCKVVDKRVVIVDEQNVLHINRSRGEMICRQRDRKATYSPKISAL